MWNRYIAFMILALLFSAIPREALRAQCFASAGNPVGGSANLGVMDRNDLRVMAFYRYHLASHYYEGDRRYEGNNRPLSSANYNYAGWLLGYGLTDRLSLETESGYYINKTQYYRLSDHMLEGYGLSNALVSIKGALYQDFDKRFEVSAAAGVNVPFSRSFLRVDGVELPVDLQPSTASCGIVLQSYIIKENSFKGLRYFWINRFEKNFESPQGYLFGDVFNTSAFISRHFVLGQGSAKDWTLILQLRYQYKGQNAHNGKITPSSGGNMLLLSPQVNCSINETWNISLLYEKTLYQYLNGIQLGANYALLVNFARDVNVGKKKTAP